MTNKVIVLLFSLAACLAIESGLKAAEIREPAARASFDLNEKQIRGAQDIAEAIYTNKPHDVLTILYNVYGLDLLAYKDLEKDLKLVTDLTGAVTTHLIGKKEKTLRFLDNIAGQLFVAIQDRNIKRLLEAQRQIEKGVKETVIEEPGLGNFVKLPLNLTCEIAEYLPEEVLEALAPTSAVFYSIAQSIREKRSADLMKYWTTSIIKVTSLKGHEGGIYSLAFSPDGKLLASGSGDSHIKLWDVQKGKLKEKYSFDAKGIVFEVAFSPNCKTITCLVETPYGRSNGRSIKFWNYKETDKTYQPIRLYDNPNAFNYFVFSPDGKLLISESEQSVRVWDLEQQKTIMVEKTRADYATLSKIKIEKKLPERKLAAAIYDDGIIQIWNTAKNREIAEFISPEGSSAYCLAFSPDGNLLVVGYRDGENDGSVRLWNIETGKEIMLLAQDKGIIPMSIAFSPDRKSIAVGYHDGTLKLIQADTQSTQPTEIVPKQRGIHEE